MKRFSLLLMCVGLVGFARRAQARESIVNADVAFPFVVGHTQLPAGHYQVVATDGTDDGVLELRNLDTGQPTIVPYLARVAARPGDQSRFVFERVGNERVLSEIRLEGAEGYVLPDASPRAGSPEPAAKRVAAR